MKKKSPSPLSVEDRKLWKKVAEELHRSGLEESRIENLVSDDDPRELARIVESL